MSRSSGEVTQLLQRIKEGDAQAASRLMSLVYAELRRLAGYYMRQERPEHTLQATALVHEAYLKLADRQALSFHDRGHFFAAAAQAMRRILVDHARGVQAKKRGGEVQQVELEGEALAFSSERPAEFLAMDEALGRMAAVLPRQSRVVELRFFGGLSVEETARILGVAPKTVKRDWSVARAWLYREIRQQA